MDARVSRNSYLVFKTHGCIFIKINFYLVVINFATRYKYKLESSSLICVSYIFSVHCPGAEARPAGSGALSFSKHGSVSGQLAGLRVGLPGSHYRKANARHDVGGA